MSKSKSRPKPGLRIPTAPVATPPSDLPRSVAIAAISIAIVTAIVLRVWASLDNFWLDEIWSWMMAGDLKNPLEVVTRLHHDNNHYLNTWVLYALGRDAPVCLYRLPAVVAGISTVLLCGWVAHRWSRAASVASALLTGCSFLLVQYSSEARGYAYLLFFTMASFALIQESLERPRVVWNVLFASCAVLGFLSHLTYLFAYVALVAWSTWTSIRRNGWLSRRHIAPIIFQVLIPGAFMVLLYLVDLRFIQTGGGDQNSVWATIAQATSAAFGGPLQGTAMTCVAVAVAAVALFALFLLARDGADLWMPMAVGIFILPAAVCLIARPQWPYPRYFLVSMLFLQLLCSWFLGWLWKRPQGRVAYLVLLALILAGNAVLNAQLLTYGRGGYGAAVRYMLDQTFGEKVAVASDHDFRNRMVLAFYVGRAGAGERIAYYEQGKWPPQGPEWVLFHSFAQPYRPEKSLQDDRGHTFELARVFPYAGLSGFHWGLYHNTNRPTNAPLHP